MTTGVNMEEKQYLNEGFAFVTVFFQFVRSAVCTLCRMTASAE